MRDNPFAIARFFSLSEFDRAAGVGDGAPASAGAAMGRAELADRGFAAGGSIAMGA